MPSMALALRESLCDVPNGNPAFYSYHPDTRSGSRLRRSGLLQANRCRTTGSHPTECYKRKIRRNGGFDLKHYDSITS